MRLSHLWAMGLVGLLSVAGTLGVMGCEEKAAAPSATPTPAPASTPAAAAPTTPAATTPEATPAPADAPAPTSTPAPAPGATPVPAGGEVIKIGHFGSMTGKEATFGMSTDRGIRLALKEINAAGGLNGRKIEVITYDTKGDSKEAGTAVTRLITSEKVVGVIGEVASSLSLAGGAVAQQYKVPMISPSSTNPRVTADRDFVFRVCFTDDFQAMGLAKFAKENLKATKAAILYDQTQAYSKGLRDEFTKSYKAMGGEIVADQAYSGGEADFSAQLATIKASGAQVVLVPGYYTEGAAIALQARRQGITVPLLGGDGWDSEELGKIGGEAIVGSYYSNHSSPDQPTMKDFVTKFKAEYDNQTPDALGGLGYDAMNLYFDAMKRAKSLSGPDLRDAIAATKGFKGVTGDITIDSKRNARKPLVIVKMTKGADGRIGPAYEASVEPPAEVVK